ncbi:MAG: acyl-ACP--UDP-N-acetylglucosamine O-acyltransferase [Alistipes senegalensis]|nr:acyl-ACP--UDP-N-acetylglucosamine O-acyltransferase [Oxalobacter formigenes]MCM1281189.1 acyl-ACP--UDP-N-acetylglucosamine O-acyltransferase [Alistipes senegalensis]
MSHIHPTAIIDPRAEIDSTAQIDAYAVIGPHVNIGAGTRIGSHVVVEGRTTIGRDNNIFQFASIGGVPQDKKYGGEPTELVIGDRNTIREYCTLNLGTVQDAGVTRVGNDNWIMAYVHIAHDCQIGSNTIFANATQLAGHVHIGDWVILGGMTTIHQFCKVGAHAMTGAATRLSQDIPPYVLVAGTPPAAYGINIEGLRRRGFTPEQIAAIRQSYKLLYKSGLSLEEAKTALAEAEAGPAETAECIRTMRLFLDTANRGIIR